VVCQYVLEMFRENGMYSADPHVFDNENPPKLSALGDIVTFAVGGAFGVFRFNM